VVTGRGYFIEERYIGRLWDKSCRIRCRPRNWSVWTTRHSQLTAVQKRHSRSRF